MYGTRGFSLKLRDKMLARADELNRILPMMFALRAEDKTVGVMCSAVDDLLCGHFDGYEDRMNDVLDSFTVMEQQEAPFRFCGKEIDQAVDLSITVAVEKVTEI